ncbi:lub1 [Candida margitis]|uniref:lub1 n=1 Tax=Candida margitis TaxID=1775924 RepID=UPI0022268871|nr:lub1 [Candida margitis]KAI5968762.1 lub1 [Candida margitis]
MTYKLSSTLSGHEQDVRGLANSTIGDEPILVSVSRDSTTRVWNHVNTSSETDSRILFHSPTKSFINSVSIVKLEQSGEELVASGGQDAMIYLSDLYQQGVQEGEAVNFDQDGKYQLIGHEGNVCAMNFAHDEFISSSWDGTAIVWNLQEFVPKFVLGGHDSSVWDCKIVNNKNQYLTASADKSIRLWQGDHEIQKFLGHTDVVRKLLVLPGGERFVSSANDGTIKIWDLQTGRILKTLFGHDSFVYDLALLPNGNLVSTGEDRTVRIWDLSKGEQAVQVITLPCISVWCVTMLPNGDFAVGGSDNQIRVFTQDPARVAPQDELKAFTEAVQSSSISEQSLDDLKKTDIPGIEALSKPGKQEGSTIMVKTADGTIEAHQWSGGEWHKIGDVVGGASSTKKQTYEGQEYDYVFDVDIKDGEPPLKLPYNLNQNPYTVAEKFLADNELPSSYTDEVVWFLETNTAGAKLSEGTTENNQAQSPALANDPYSDAYARQHSSGEQPQVATSIIPETQFISYKEFKKDTILNGLKKLNQSQETSQFTEEEISTISGLISNLSSGDAVELILNYATKIISSWNTSSKLIGFDLIRIALGKITAHDFLGQESVAQTVSNSIESGLEIIDSSNATLFMMIMKVLANFIGGAGFIQAYIDPFEGDSTRYIYNATFQKILHEIGQKATALDSSAKLYAAAITALASFVYDLSTVQIKTTGLNSHSETSAAPVLDLVAKIGDTVVKSSGEAGYRLAIAYGNFKYIKAYPTNAPPSQWLNKWNELYASKEQRFNDLARDLTLL